MKEDNMERAFQLAPRQEQDEAMRRCIAEMEADRRAERESQDVEQKRIRAEEASMSAMLHAKFLKGRAAAPNTGSADARSIATSSQIDKSASLSATSSCTTVISSDAANDATEELLRLLTEIEDSDAEPEQRCKPGNSVTPPSKGIAQPAERVPEAGGGLPNAPLAPGEKPATTALPNAFPVDDEMSFERVGDPLRAMKELCFRLLDHKDYHRERSEYCQLSIQMNLCGKLAPAFRPELSSGAKFGDSVHHLLNRDRLVIDFHWCATRMEIHPNDVQYAALFAPGRAFSFLDAWALSGKIHKGRYRATEALMLTTFQQCQTHSLWGPELTDRMSGVYSGYRDSGGRYASRHATAKKKIREWTERMPRMKAERHVYEHLWDARELLGKENVTLVGELLALMLGQPKLDRKTIKGKLEKLDKQVQL